jgi:GT2 family glycosyltransferase
MIYILTVNYNTWEHTQILLNSIFKSSHIEKRIVVVDNCSTNNSIECLRVWLEKEDLHYDKFVIMEESKISVYYKSLPEVTFIKSEKNRGFAGGNNLGLQLISRYKQAGDLLWLINNDTTINCSTIDNIIKFVNNINDKKFAIGIKVLLENSKKAIDSEGWGYLNLLTGKVRHTHSYELFNLKYIVGSSIIMNDIVYMDDNFFLYFEDVDYSIELKKNNFMLLYCQDAKIYHKINSTTKKITTLKLIKLESLIYFYNKRFPYLLPIIILERFFTYLFLLKIKELKFLIFSLKQIKK